jgi:hypothetical protein
MNDIFADVRDYFVVVYLVDILIYSEVPAKHNDHVCLILERLIQHGLAVCPKKCLFDLTEINFLGHIISVDGIRTPCGVLLSSTSASEINYDVGDKELLAIVEGFKHFQHYAISAPASSPVKILSDHKKLERFTTLSKLSRHQF